MRMLRLFLAVAVAMLLFSTTPFLRSLPAGVIAGAITYARLGPVDGWRCLTPAPYRYDPRRAAPDRRLVAATAFGGGAFIPEQVDVSLGTDRAVVRGRLLSTSGQVTPRAVTLHAMAAQPMSVDLPWQSVSTCDAGLRAWRVVAL